MYSPRSPCSQCMATKLRLKREGIPFVSETATDEQVEAWRSEFSSFPVVVVVFGGGASWTFAGYRHEDITRLKELRQELAQGFAA